MATYLSIQLNGIPVFGFAGETIYECAERHGIEIPCLCHDPRLEPGSSCRLCMVQLAGITQLQPACSTYLQDGMTIDTENELLTLHRKKVLEEIVSRHYADCLPPCTIACPAGVDIQAVFALWHQGHTGQAIAWLRKENPLAAFCGWLCPHPCEAACKTRLPNHQDIPVNIREIEQYIAEKQWNTSKISQPAPTENDQKKVAVIGSGPGGLATAMYLNDKGYHVVVFDTNAQAGGWLRYELTNAQLPEKILKRELAYFRESGIQFKTGEQPASDSEGLLSMKGFDATVHTQQLSLDQIQLSDITVKTEENLIRKLEINPLTLQTSIPNVFAFLHADLDLTTFTEALSQARTLAQSVHLFLSDQAVEIQKTNFLSHKKNLFPIPEINQQADNPSYKGKSEKNLHPPSLAGKIHNLSDDDQVIEATQACTSCGCPIYYTCKLREYATLYQAEQQPVKSGYQPLTKDISHPFIALDPDRCIACGRCVRICTEVVGANALELVINGGKTYATPVGGRPLIETECESCGLCITTCPTAAISINSDADFAPLPLLPVQAVDMVGSEGYEIELQHFQSKFYAVRPWRQSLNRPILANRRQLFGYKYFSHPDRITKPLMRFGNQWKEISFDEAYDSILNNIKKVLPDENAFFGGARLTNEELYLIQKIARAGVKTNNTGSFHYVGRGEGYVRNSNENATYCDIRGASKLFVAGGELHLNHPIVNHLIMNTRFKEGVKLVHITTKPQAWFSRKADQQIVIKNYFYFIKAVNHFILKHGLYDEQYIQSRTEGWEEYRNAMLKDEYAYLIERAGATHKTVADFAADYTNEMNALLLFEEKELSGNASLAMHNLAMITGKLGKTATGILALKERNNSHGIFDMGLSPDLGPGAEPILDPDLLYRLEFVWKTTGLPDFVHNLEALIEAGKLRNAFIFGEDPVGCAIDRDAIRARLEKIDFLMVQDLFMSDTARMATLVLPASFPWEMGGSYTNSQRRIQQIERQLEGPVASTSFVQLNALASRLSLASYNRPQDALNEALSLFPIRGDYKELHFVYKEKDNANRQFLYGCDVLNKRIDEEFAEKLGDKFAEN